MKGLTLDRQISELTRACNERVTEYARLVRAGKMRESEAEYRLEGLNAALESLYWLQRNRAVVLAAAVEAKAQGETGETPA